MALVDRTVSKAGFQLIIRSGTVAAKIRTEVLAGLAEINTNYRDQVDKNLALDDHTLAELRSLGYPYAVGKATNTPHDDRQLHEQSGELRKSIKTTTPSEDTSRKFSVYVTSNSPYTQYLIFGTSRMRPRRFHEKAFDDIKDKFWNPLLERLKKVNYRIEIGATTARQIGK
jgi:HK97 gp10 family phage protein